MAKLINRYNWGSQIKNVNDTLYIQLNDSFTTIARVVNTKPSKYTTNTDAPADDPINVNFEEGDIWVNTSTNTAWIMTSRSTNTAVTWTQIT